MRLTLATMVWAAFLALFTAPALAQWLPADGVVYTPEENGPVHPDRADLEAAFGAERDPERAAILAANLDRWRNLPAQLGQRHLIVNVAAQEVVLWENGAPVQRWDAIVGRTSTQTVSFSTTVSGVNLNPWWYIPDSIVRRSVGALVRNRPAEARRRGYVVENGRYRQRPGPANALGRMKLVMPNQHAIYLHDTPSQNLFDETTRTFSAGCIRVQDAMGFAARLLEMDQADVEAIAANGRTQTLDLAEPIPVHITYLTAVPTRTGEPRYLDDIYGRDNAG